MQEKDRLFPENGFVWEGPKKGTHDITPFNFERSGWGMNGDRSNGGLAAVSRTNWLRCGSKVHNKVG